MNKIVTIFNLGIEPVHMYKDVFLTGYYLSKDMGLDYELWACDKYPELARGCQTKAFSKELGLKPFLEQLKQDAKSIDVLMLFQTGICNFKIVHTYLKYNPNGKVYIKLDFNANSNQHIQFEQKNIAKYLVKKVLYRWYIDKVIVFSVETQAVYDKLLRDKFYGVDISKKLVLMCNGLDDEKISTLRAYKYEEKENIAISVGRIGSYPKNNESVLSVLNNLDMRDWKYYFIGSYTREFAELLELSPNRDKIFLTGNISEREVLYSYYNRAKVFVLSSVYEGACLVINEAVYCNDFIVSTKVATSPETVQNNNKIGILYDSGDQAKLTEILDGIFTGATDVSSVEEEIAPFKESLYYCKIIKELSERLK